MDVIKCFFRILYFTLLYGFLFLGYVFLQELYVETCTHRAGLINMLASLPVCNHLLFILKFVGDHFLSLAIGFTTLTLSMLR